MAFFVAENRIGMIFCLLCSGNVEADHITVIILIDQLLSASRLHLRMVRYCMDEDKH